jgi:hypothetical protein
MCQAQRYLRCDLAASLTASKLGVQILLYVSKMEVMPMQERSWKKNIVFMFKTAAVRCLPVKYMHPAEYVTRMYGGWPSECVHNNLIKMIDALVGFQTWSLSNISDIP